MGKQWKQWETIFLASKITADHDCSHKIKRHLLLGRKSMTNLDSTLKCRDISQSYVFPVVMYGCESWTTKKAESLRIDVFKLWYWRRLLRLPWTVRWSDQSTLKEISPEYSLEGLMLKLKLQLSIWCEKLTHWKRPWCWERLRAGGEEGSRGWEAELKLQSFG